MTIKKFAVKGEIVTCENGHPIYKVLEDIISGQECRSTAFKGLNGVPDPKEHELMPLTCPHCNGLALTTKVLYVNGEKRGMGNYVDWESRQPGATTLPELIEGQAKGTLKVIDGIVYERPSKKVGWIKARPI